jgi:superfamily II DNA or RNA helicase
MTGFSDAWLAQHNARGEVEGWRGTGGQRDASLPVTGSHDIGPVGMRPYQWALDERRRANAERRVLVQLPTGGGKSRLIQAAADDRTLVLAHAEWLIDQLHELVGGCVLKAGMPVPDAWPIIGMVQTVARRDMPEPRIVIVDEAHHTASRTYRDILARWPEARIYGFTATPQRLDGQGLNFDELLCGPSYRELIAGGWLKPFEVMSIPSGVELHGARIRAGDFAKEDVKRAIRRSTIFGDVVEHWRLHCRDLGGHASFWPSIEAAEHAAERFGHGCHALHSKLPRERVRALVAGLRSGSVQSLATVDMIGEGLDVPGLASVSCCRPTASLQVYLQQRGRCNRGGTGVARIMDHVGDWQRHGLPDDDREWTLAGRVRSKRDPGTLSVWSCPECWAVTRSTSPACSRCGALKPRELVEMETRAAELELINRASVADVHEVCTSPEDYARFAKAKGKTLSWAALKLWERDNRASNDNAFLAAAGQLKPTRAEFLAAAAAVGMDEVRARESAKLHMLRWG